LLEHPDPLVGRVAKIAQYKLDVYVLRGNELVEYYKPAPIDGTDGLL
jgi:hypothetical protein